MKTKPKEKGNHTMKKIIAIALAAVFVLSFAACAKQNGESGTTTPSDAPKGRSKVLWKFLKRSGASIQPTKNFPQQAVPEKAYEGRYAR